MDINVLVVNVGNTRLAVGAFSGGSLEFVKRVLLSDRVEVTATIREAWAQLVDHKAEKDNIAIAGASVNPAQLESVERLIQQVTGQDVEWVGKDLDLPIGVMTDQPKETGVDRVLNVAAAHQQIGKACVVVDAGTAITVDLCNDAGEFLGGAIVPGVNMMLESLHERTAKLPLVKLETPTGQFGTNTEAAIRHGVFHGIRGMVKELVENYATSLGNWPELIATGGDAVALFEGWELVHAVSPDLTLYGIALAYAEHHIKNGT